MGFLTIPSCTGKKDSKASIKGNQEIGSVKDKEVYELRVVHPEQEHTFAIELEGKEFFPIQDAHHNICALQNSNGSLAQWGRFSAFGEKVSYGDLQLENPWGYANRRELASLVLFTHRFYHPRQMRWLTTDPIGFQDGLNLYRFVRNNPYCYRDPDGQNAIFIIPILEFTFGAALGPLVVPTLGAIATAAVIYSSYQLVTHMDAVYNQVDADNEEKTEQDGKRKQPPYCGQELEDDPTKSPGPGFEWRGRGEPGTGQGSWVKDLGQSSEVSFHPDLNHKPPKGPHWDYKGPDGDGRAYLDGRWEWK